jgi:hypothetical protein
MADIRQQTADRRQQTADSRQQTADSRQQTADSRQQTADSRQQTRTSRAQLAHDDVHGLASVTLEQARHILQQKGLQEQCKSSARIM